MSKGDKGKGRLKTLIWVLIIVINVINITTLLILIPSNSKDHEVNNGDHEEVPTEEYELQDQDSDEVKDEEANHDDYLDKAFTYTQGIDTFYSDYYDLMEEMGKLGESMKVVKEEQFIKRYNETIDSLEETLDLIEGLVAPEEYQHIQDNLLKFVNAYREIKVISGDVSQLKREDVSKITEIVGEGNVYYIEALEDIVEAN